MKVPRDYGLTPSRDAKRLREKRDCLQTEPPLIDISHHVLGVCREATFY